MRSWVDVLNEFLGKYSSNAEALSHALTRQGLHRLDRMDHGAVLCHKGDAPDCFWLVVDGQVDVYEGPGAPIRKRWAGDLIGEQAFLIAQTPCMTEPDGKAPGRTAMLTCHGNTTLLRFDAALIDTLTVEERSLWYELLAQVINVKLVEATWQRAEQAAQAADRNSLLSRFCDVTALGTVQAIVNGNRTFTSVRDVVVWFSDIAGFSTWSKGRASDEVAEAAKLLLGLQVKLVRQYRGEIDKIMGDGLMAYWFCDGHLRSGVPKEAYLCAKKVAAEFARTAAERGMGELALRIGLHTGPACFGDFGTEDRIAVTLLGETINLGSRYEQLRADPERYPNLGPIRLSKALHDLISADGRVGGLNGPVEAIVKQDHFVIYWAEGGSDGLE